MKTILLDIETAPSLGYIWGVWKQNIGHDMMVSHGTYIMSCTIKTLGEDDIVYLESRTENDLQITKDILEYLDEADFVIAHNGRRFDLPIINARAIVNNLLPPSPYKIIDTLSIAKKEFRFQRNTLKFLAEHLEVPSRKLDHGKYPGFKLWLGCMNQEDEAWLEMRDYNIADVVVLEEVYMKLRPWASTHPNVTTADEEVTKSCPKCGSANIARRGFFYTNKGKYQRYACGSCGAWSSETSVQNTPEKRLSLLASR